MRLRRDLVRAAVRENVYNKAGKRPPREEPRRWGRWAALGLLVPAIAAATVLLRPPAGGSVIVGSRDLRAGSARAATVRRQPLAAPSSHPGSPPTFAAAGPLLAPSLADIGPLDASVFPVGVRRIVLDPGHGGKDHGTEAAGGLYEKDVALDIALRLRDLLRQRGMEVLLTRDRDQQVLLRERARFANDAKADLFVSIHLNSLLPASNRGVETFYLGPTDDPEAVQLASRENLESGYSLADVRKLLDGIYMDLRGKESQQLAGAVQRSLFGSLDRAADGALRDRGVKSAPFLVLVATEMPAILAEVSCLSNEQDARLLGSVAYRQDIAEALRSGIEAYTLKLSHENPTTVAAPAAAPAPTAIQTGSAT